MNLYVLFNYMNLYVLHNYMNLYVLFNYINLCIIQVNVFKTTKFLCFVLCLTSLLNVIYFYTEIRMAKLMA